jgi:hypothetical protein
VLHEKYKSIEFYYVREFHIIFPIVLFNVNFFGNFTLLFQGFLLGGGMDVNSMTF